MRHECTGLIIEGLTSQLEVWVSFIEQEKKSLKTRLKMKLFTLWIVKGMLDSLICVPLLIYFQHKERH